MPCTYCNVQFTLIKWKTKCQFCSRQFCSNCTIQKKCLACRNVLESQLNYDCLMRLKVKDLKIYLSCRNIPVNLCKEKHELVQMILHHHDLPVIHAQSVPIQVQINRYPNLGTRQSHERLNVDRRDTESGVSERLSSQDVSGNSHASRNTNRGASGGTEEANTTSSQSVDTNAVASEQSEENISGTAGGNDDSTSTVEIDVPIPTPTGNRNKLLITDIKMVAQIEGLTARQMKQILTDNFVDYKGCVEKSELRIRVTNLYHDKSRNEEQQNEGKDTNEENICKICWDGPIDCVLLECGHMATCTACGKRLSECPICRQYIVRCVHVFKP